MQRILLALTVVLVAAIAYARFTRRPAPAAPPSPATLAVIDDPSVGRAEQVIVDAVSANYRDARLTYLPVADLPATVQRGGGAPTVLVLYGTNCPLSQRLMPGLQALAGQYAPRGARFYVYNDDLNLAAYDIPSFLATANAAFPAVRIGSWSPGSLSRALRAMGSAVIDSGATYTRPVVVVWGPDGTLAVESQAMPDAEALGQVLAGLMPAPTQ